MEPKRLLGIFNEELQIVAFISSGEKGVEVEIFDDSEKGSIEQALAPLSQNNPDLKLTFITSEESGALSREVEVGDRAYLDAIAEELSGEGWLCHIVGENAKDVLIMLSEPQITIEQREKVLGEIVNMSSEDGVILDEYLEKIRAI